MLEDWKNVNTVVVGMLHLPALPGSPNYAGAWQAIEKAVLKDAEALVQGGVHGVMLENFGDVPFYKNQVPAVTVAAMTRLAAQVKQVTGLPLGINVLRNDGLSAMSIASVVDAQWIRVNVLSGAVVTDQGLIEGEAATLLRLKKELGSQVHVLADVRVKHAAPLAARSIPEEVDELCTRAGASGLIVTGTGTGKPTDLDDLRAVKACCPPGAWVWVGSGVTDQSAPVLAKDAKGLIVGTWLKSGGISGNPVDVSRVRSIVDSTK